MADRDSPSDAIDPLQILVGEWIVTVPGFPPGRMSVEWALHGRYLLQRSAIPDSTVPDSLAMVAVSSEGEGFTQHYFDQRGVVRLYQMSLTDSHWILTRTRPDFSPLNFSQRFVGTFSEDGNTIDGAWESATDGDWQVDFPLRYTRA